MFTEGARGFPHLSSMTKLVTTTKQWLQWHRVDVQDRLPCLITLPIAVPTVTTTSPPSGDNAGASGAYFMMYRVSICMLPLSTSSNPPSSQSGLITGVVVGVLVIVLVPVVLSAVFGFLHLNKIRKNSHSRRSSRASLSRQSCKSLVK